MQILRHNISALCNLLEKVEGMGRNEMTVERNEEIKYKQK